MRKMLALAFCFQTGLAATALADGMNGAIPPPAMIRDSCGPGGFHGLYVGGNVGRASLESDRTDRDGFTGAGAINVGTYSTTEDGWAAGVQIGYNWQCGHVLFGVEADWSWLDVADHEEIRFGYFLPDAYELSSSMDWLVTLRTRTGLNFDRLLLYVTGGLALADIEHRWTDNHGTSTSYPDTVKFSDTRWGWVIGVGTEWAIRPDITLKSEALFVRFEEESDTSKTYTYLTPCTCDDQSFRFDHDDSVWVVRTGLNYKFGHREPLPAPLK
jgi:outer membrane immunogenic protein